MYRGKNEIKMECRRNKEGSEVMVNLTMFQVTFKK